MSKISVLSRITGAIAPAVTLNDIRARLTVARTKLTDCEAVYRRANLDAEIGTGSATVRQEALDAVKVAKQRVSDLSAAERELAAEENRRLTRAAAAAEAAKDRAVVATLDALNVAAKRLEDGAKSYMSDWQTFVAAHRTAVDASKARPRMRRDIATDAPGRLVVHELTRMASISGAPLPPGADLGLTQVCNAATLPPLTAAVGQYIAAVKAELSLDGPAE